MAFISSDSSCRSLANKSKRQTSSMEICLSHFSGSISKLDSLFQFHYEVSTSRQFLFTSGLLDYIECLKSTDQAAEQSFWNLG